MPEDQTAAQRIIGDLAPKLVELTDDLVFGDIWERPELSPRDRSLITVTTLIALYRTDQLDFHLRKALDNGLTKEELAEVITHLAFYAGWPNSMTAIAHLRGIVERPDAEAGGA
ncbi:carboxymuconolactone decarboxylase family protein [Streptomyces sp. NPDC127098]|uniref:carboxymuconolactone decarboxylase family protein n=1 Tax=Streptomyces sp. NPDC127098 TaxID=3347137 RepID=UPI0036488D24